MAMLRNIITKKFNFAELDESLSNFEIKDKIENGTSNKDTYKVINTDDNTLHIFKFITVSNANHIGISKYEDICGRLKIYSFFCQTEIKVVNSDLLQCSEPYFPKGTLINNFSKNEEIQNQQISEICAILNKTSILNILIGNIKPQNILFNDESNVVICDYCQYLLKQKDQNISTEEMKYMSPEMLEDKDIGITSDIWSLGCVIYYIKTGRNMFADSNKQELVIKIRNCEYEKLQDNRINELLEHIIVYDQNRRYSISYINDCLKEKKIISSQNTIVCLPSSRRDDDSIKSLIDQYNETNDKDVLNLIIKRCVIKGESLTTTHEEIADVIISSIIDKNVMKIDDKYLTPDIVKEISNNIKVYESIEVLKIENTTLDEKIISLISDIIPQLPNLNTLSLSSVSPFNSFSFVINTQLQKLASLDISSNHFTLKSSTELKNSLKYMPNLEHLHLRSVTAYEDIIYPIIEAIPQLKHLKTLDIRGNSISDTEIEEIDELIKQNHLLYVSMIDEMQKLKKETEWVVIHDSEPNVLTVTRSIKYLSSNKSLSSVLEPFAKTLDTLTFDLSNLTNDCLKEIAEIPKIYIKIKKIKFSHLYTQYFFKSDGLTVLLPLLSSQIITLDIFIAYFVNESNILRDKNYYSNLKELGKYKEMEEIYKKNEVIDEITVDSLKSKISFNSLSSIPYINVLTVKNYSFDSMYKILSSFKNFKYMEVENIELRKKEFDKIIEMIENEVLSPNIIKEYIKKNNYYDVVYAKKICIKIKSKKEKISNRLRKSIQRILIKNIGLM